MGVLNDPSAPPPQFKYAAMLHEYVSAYSLAGRTMTKISTASGGGLGRLLAPVLATGQLRYAFASVPADRTTSPAQILPRRRELDELSSRASAASVRERDPVCGGIRSLKASNHRWRDRRR